jgi:adenylylsulfate kinase-like enzyme
MIIWFQGISGVGKTTIAKKLFLVLKKKFFNLIFLDGDDFRKIMLHDLGYSLKDRNTNADRMINLVKYLSNQKVNIICSANLTTHSKRVKARRVLKNYIDIYLDAKLSKILKKHQLKML